jgi:hypothetical protein
VADRDRLTIGLPRAATLSGCRHCDLIVTEQVTAVELAHLACPRAGRRHDFDVHRDGGLHYSGDARDDGADHGVFEHDAVPRPVGVRQRLEAASPRHAIGGDPRIEPRRKVHCRHNTFPNRLIDVGLIVPLATILSRHTRKSLGVANERTFAPSSRLM